MLFAIRSKGTELTGAINLVQYYRLFPHYAHYLHNVVGDKEIRKGERMQLNQLINDNKSISQEAIHPFDLNALGDAFHLRETAPIELPDKRKVDGDEDLSGIHRYQNTKYKRSKMDEFGVIRIAA
ncbi:putative mediator complex, subunit Med19, metazoa [Helianthus anomalus]